MSTIWPENVKLTFCRASFLKCSYFFFYFGDISTDCAVNDCRVSVYVQRSQQLTGLSHMKRLWRCLITIIINQNVFVYVQRLFITRLVSTIFKWLVLLPTFKLYYTL